MPSRIPGPSEDTDSFAVIPCEAGFEDAAPGPASARLPITVVIPTLNEEHQIQDAVFCSSEWADEVIVVDGGSNDDTIARAEAAGAKVFQFEGNNIGAQRNQGASNARHSWVFALDADERLSEELKKELRSVLNEARHTAYRVRMRNLYLGRERKRGRWGRDWHVRLHRRDLRFRETRVHERLEDVPSTGTLLGAVLHTPYRDLSHHLAKMITYARWGALDLHGRGRRATIRDLLWRPIWRFLRDYLLYGSFLDGRYGLLTSVLTGYSSFLKYAFLYELGNSDVPQGGPDSSRDAVSG